MRQSDKLDSYTREYDIRTIRRYHMLGRGEMSEEEKKAVSELHGVGANALKVIEREMDSLHIEFAAEDGESEAKTRARYPSIESYIESFPEATRAGLREMREIIGSAAPEAVEKISYNMPTFFLEGNLVPLLHRNDSMTGM